MVQEGVKLKYGPIKGNTELYIPAVMGASEVISAASGRFAKTDGSGRLEIAGDGDTELVGWIASHAQTASATEGATSVSLIPAAACLGLVFRIPVNSGTYVAAMRYDTCDISVSSNIQGAQLDASAEDTLIIVDGDTVNNNWVDCQINPAKLGATGVV